MREDTFLAVFMGFGVTFSAYLYFVGDGDWLLASAVFIVANIGFAGVNVFYEGGLRWAASTLGEIREHRDLFTFPSGGRRGAILTGEHIDRRARMIRRKSP